MNLGSLKISSGWDSFTKFRKKKFTGLSTGVVYLDKALGGLSGFTIIQGEPAACKSTLCLQIAGSMAKMGHPVFMIDCENGANRLRLRLICQLNEIGQSQVLAGTDEEEDQWHAQLNTLPIFVENQLLVPSVEEAKEGIIAILKALYREYNKPVIFVADSLQSLPQLHDDPRLNIEAWLKFFDSVKVAADGMVNILVTSEKRRGTYNDAFKDGGKGSGAIEYKGETILDLQKNAETGNIIMVCVKNRDGADGFKIVLQKQKSSYGQFCFLLSEGEQI